MRTLYIDSEYGWVPVRDYDALMAEQNSMRKWAGGWGWLIPIFLVASLVSNILGVTLPFLELDEAFHAKVIYSLPHSVWLMWEHELYFVAALILGFSIIFPFVKLASLFAAWFLPWKSNRRATFLHIIELLGKWSFMDIFVVILLLALTNKQMFISSTIHIGVYFFIGAITLSMILSQIILSMARKKITEERPPITHSSKRRWMLFHNLYLGWIVPVLVFVSAIALVESLYATFFKISQWFFVSRSYSISEIAELLQNNHQWVLLITMVGTLAVIPMSRLVILFFGWIIPMKVVHHIRLRMILEGLARWSMLDVFGIALFLVTMEGSDLINTKIQPGLYIVLAAIALSYLLSLVAVAFHTSMVKNEEVNAAS